MHSKKIQEWANSKEKIDPSLTEERNLIDFN